MHISRPGDQSYVTQPFSSPLTRQDLSLLFISLSLAPSLLPLSSEHVVCVQNKSVNNKYPHCVREFVLKHVAPLKNKNVNLKCRWLVLCACMCACAAMCHVCILAAIREAVKSHRGALEVFYHAAVIVACLLVVTLSTVCLQGDYSVRVYSAPPLSPFIPNCFLSFTITF